MLVCEGWRGLVTNFVNVVSYSDEYGFSFALKQKRKSETQQIAALPATRRILARGEEASLRARTGSRPDELTADHLVGPSSDV